MAEAQPNRNRVLQEVTEPTEEMIFTLITQRSAARQQSKANSNSHKERKKRLGLRPQPFARL